MFDFPLVVVNVAIVVVVVKLPSDLQTYLNFEVDGVDFVSPCHKNKKNKNLNIVPSRVKDPICLKEINIFYHIFFISNLVDSKEFWNKILLIIIVLLKFFLPEISGP